MNPFLISVPAAVLATGGVAAYGAVHPRSQLFGPMICRTNSPRKLALTFDDGPNPAITPKLLDLLDRYQARATFFLIGRFVRECPDLVKETVARGHVVGNHTELHPSLLRLSPMKIRVELRLCHNAIREAIGAPPKWFRPPYGRRNPWVVPAARELGCQTVLWTLLPGDWHEKPADWLVSRLQPIADRAKKAQPTTVEEKADPSASSRGGPRAEGRDDKMGKEKQGRQDDKWGVAAGGKSGDILCLHDGWHRELNADRTPTLAALEHWLPRWRDLGLEFVTMDEAVRTPAS